MLQHFGVTPYIVFDGDYLPSKAATEADREKRREDSKRSGLDLLNAGKTSQAYLEFQKAVDVTPEMARQLIDELRKTQVQYVVAPYEADAQMVYLERKGIVDGILSEDSDLLVFGAKCLLTKLDQYGNCIEINKADFCACKEVTLTGWSDVEFRQMAILSGCDYLASINNMGLKTAYRMVRKHKTIEKVLRMLQFDGKFHVPKGYLEDFRQASSPSSTNGVFCPRTQSIVFHTQPDHPIDDQKMHYIGAYVEPTIAQGVARGDLNPMTKLPIVVNSRKKMVTSITPWSARHPSTSVTADDLKKGVSLEMFFKPKRVPLAELDINCFTPSPSQQQALQRNPGAWNASPVPRPYLSRSATEPDQLPRSGPPQLRQDPVRTHGRTLTISEPRPPKRARLCADIDTVETPSGKVELGPSRFFAPVAPEPSPTVGRNVRSKRLKKQDINIFSDDSIEEAMLNLPDAEGFGSQGRKSAKIAIFEEAEPSSQKGTTTQRTKNDSDKIPCNLEDPPLIWSASATSSFEQPSTPSEPPVVPTAVEKLKERFVFNGASTTTPKSWLATQGLPTPSSSVLSRQSRIPLAVKGNTPASKGSLFFTPKTLTPLQRLAANATTRSKLPMTPPLTPVLSMKPKSSCHSILGKDFVPFPEVAHETQSRKPALIPLPVPDENENKVLNNMTGGSEDLIIHDSEDDDGDALSPGPEDSCLPPHRFDFGRFAYGGRA
jgi:exonuclease-1